MHDVGEGVQGRGEGGMATTGTVLCVGGKGREREGGVGKEQAAWPRQVVCMKWGKGAQGRGEGAMATTGSMHRVGEGEGKETGGGSGGHRLFHRDAGSKHAAMDCSAQPMPGAARLASPSEGGGTCRGWAAPTQRPTPHLCGATHRGLSPGRCARRAAQASGAPTAGLRHLRGG
eukprot:262543-Chlamydomonas_euryale.AAC.12